MRPPTALTVSALDPSGATGLPADLKTFTALGVYGAAAATGSGLTAEAVREQVESALEDVEPDAAKIGLLGTSAVADAAADAIAAHRGAVGRLVLDPVMVSDAGETLVSAEAARVLRDRLLPLADVLTPVPLEAAQLLGEPEAATTLDALGEQALALRSMGVGVVVISGACGADGETVDVVAHEGGVDLLRAQRPHDRTVLGTRDTLSAAITAQFARIAQFERAGELGEIGDAGSDDDDLTIVASAREFVASAVAHAADWTLRGARRGAVPLNHLITLDRD